MCSRENVSYWTRRRRIRAAVATEMLNMTTSLGDDTGDLGSTDDYSVDSQPLLTECNEQDLEEIVCDADIASSLKQENENNSQSVSTAHTDPMVYTGHAAKIDTDDCLENVLFEGDSSYDSDVTLDSMSDTEENILSPEEDDIMELDKNEEWSFQLSQWAIKNNINQDALHGLLKILREKHPFLPKDPRSLLGTITRYNPAIQTVSNGDYYHFGVAEGLLYRLSPCSSHCFPSDNIIKIQVNIDGLPIHKSALNQFWPILCMVEAKCPEIRKPFIAGLYYSKNKPSDTDFLNPFISDMKSLERSGINICNVHFNVEISCFVCDAPARSFVKQVKSHTGYHGCEKCKQRGKWVQKMTFPETNSDLRTDKEFFDQTDELHHHDCSPLKDLSVGMVSGFPLDYMHLVCLGVQRKLIMLWMSGPLNVRVGSRVVQLISEGLVNIRSFVPKEFVRKPRSLSAINQWKATEFRQFLLYTGIVILKDKIPNPLYMNFLTLFSGISILLGPKKPGHYSYAGELLIFFVKEFANLYGQSELVYNIHNLVHLAQDSENFGSLDNFSAFPFENALGKLKKLVRKAQLPLQQVIRRICEQKSLPQSGCHCSVSQNKLKLIHSNGPLVGVDSSCRQFKEMSFDGFCIRCETGDNCVAVNKMIVIVENILEKEDGDIVIVYRKFRQMSNFFLHPLKSSSLGIYELSDLSHKFETAPYFHVKVKYFLLPYRNKHVAIPLRHKIEEKKIYL